MSPVGSLISTTKRLFRVCQWSAGQTSRWVPHVELFTDTSESLSPSASYTTLYACSANGGTNRHGRAALTEKYITFGESGTCLLNFLQFHVVKSLAACTSRPSAESRRNVPIRPRFLTHQSA